MVNDDDGYTVSGSKGSKSCDGLIIELVHVLSSLRRANHLECVYSNELAVRMLLNPFLDSIQCLLPSCPRHSHMGVRGKFFAVEHVLQSLVKASVVVFESQVEARSTFAEQTAETFSR